MDAAIDSDTLSGMLAARAAARPDAPALHFEGQVLRCADLDRGACALAARLWHEWGVRPGDRVAWLGLNHPGQVLLLFALARIGAMLLPLNVRLAPAEWETLLAECTPLHLVHDDAFASAAQALACRSGLRVHDLASLRHAEAGEVPDHAAPGAPVLLVFTSGTTSRPKAAVHTQANLLANMRIAATTQRMTPDDVVLTVLPLFHVGGLCIQTLPALYAGAQVVLLPRFTPEATFEAIGRHRPTLTLQVPATMKALAEHPRWAVADLACLRAVWAGSSLLPAPLVQAFHARGLPVCNVYGSTETGPFSIALPPEHAFDHVGSCGWPPAGVEVRLADVQRGTGELWVRAANVVQRYWPDLPARDADGWFRTGDLAKQAVDGSYAIVGRSRDLIISGGENIHPAEIEGPLAEHPAVLECAAFGVPDPQWGEAVAVALVLRPGAQASDEELRAHLAARVARYKLPRHCVRLEALPKTALGKVRRQALAALLDP
ncbi:class I adenylate-forming enzyme family protein [Ramlibacter sp.]|uniref:class I adenylate-forming enzyme family protein n=1 Tax=Ramlibacter sp. TaxID=1917967 RepID=UPI002FCBC5EC